MVVAVVFSFDEVAHDDDDGQWLGSKETVTVMTMRKMVGGLYPVLVCIGGKRRQPQWI